MLTPNRLIAGEIWLPICPVGCVEVPEPKTVKNRMHLDVRIRDRAHFDQLLDMGARIPSRHETRLVLADPEGNEFCAVGDWIRTTI